MYWLCLAPPQPGRAVLPYASRRSGSRDHLGRLDAGVSRNGYRNRQTDGGRSGPRSPPHDRPRGSRGPLQRCRVPGGRSSRSQDVSDRGVPALIVGGSGLHFRALVDPLDFPPHDPDVRVRIEAMGHETARAKSDPLEVDATAAQVIDLAEHRCRGAAGHRGVRIDRPSSARAAGPTRQAVADYLAVTPFTAAGVDPGSELQQRVDRRLEEMLSAGFLDELARLQGSLGPDCLRGRWVPAVAAGSKKGHDLAARCESSPARRHGPGQTATHLFRPRSPHRVGTVVEHPVQRYQRVKERLLEEP